MQATASSATCRFGLMKANHRFPVWRVLLSTISRLSALGRMATPLLQSACLPPRQEGAQTMRRVLRVSPLPNCAFDKSRLRQLGFRLDGSTPPR
jgi:hypothetical protein